MKLPSATIAPALPTLSVALPTWGLEQSALRRARRPRPRPTRGSSLLPMPPQARGSALETRGTLKQGVIARVTEGSADGASAADLGAAPDRFVSEPSPSGDLAAEGPSAGPAAEVAADGSAAATADPDGSAPTTAPSRGTAGMSLLARLGQSVNARGIASFAELALRDRGRAVPHLDVPHLGVIDWEKLKEAGFRAVVFDKDNTLTKPYELMLAAREARVLAEATRVFGPANVGLFSNSAGLAQFDPDGEEARDLERALGVPVLRHTEKKPAAGWQEVSAALGGAPPQAIVMVGDRYLTDVTYGNRHGMFTIRPRPLTAEGEPRAVRLARWVEERCVVAWVRAGAAAPAHEYLPDPHDALTAEGRGPPIAT